jgi:hypothetical protein
VSDVNRLLETSTSGVKWTPPPEGTGGKWLVTFTPDAFALAPDEDAELAMDLVVSARESFDRQWLARPRLRVGARPKTASPSFTPIVETSTATLGPTRMLRVLRRVAWESDLEIVVGELIVPVGDGTVEIRVMHRVEGKVVPETDPAHPVARARRALDIAAPRIEVAVGPTRSPGYVFEAALCGFAPPPRFLPMKKSLASGQVLLQRAGLDGWKRTLDVWRVGELRQPNLDPRPALAAEADALVRNWTKEGADNVQIDTRFLDAFGNRPQIEQHVRFRANDVQQHTVMRWWLEPDGILYRIGSNAPMTVPKDPLSADLDQVQATWQRL